MTPEREAAGDAHLALLRSLFPGSIGHDGPVIDAINAYQGSWELVLDAYSRWQIMGERDDRRLMARVLRRLIELEPVHGLPPPALRQALRAVRSSCFAHCRKNYGLTRTP